MYKVVTPGSRFADNTTVRLDLDNEPQPDAALFIDASCGGHVRISEDDDLERAPELIAKIAASSASYDLGDKKHVYSRNEVKEHIVWQMFENKLDWFVLKDDNYAALEPDEDGILRSLFFPGLWLDLNALLSGEMQSVLATLQNGLSSVEHSKFVDALSSQLNSN